MTEYYSRYLVAAAIDEYVPREDYRILLKCKLVDGMTYEAAAEEAGFSVQHAKALVKRHAPMLLRRAEDE